jgi:hypothetical protein
VSDGDILYFAGEVEDILVAGEELGLTLVSAESEGSELAPELASSCSSSYHKIVQVWFFFVVVVVTVMVAIALLVAVAVSSSCVPRCNIPTLAAACSAVAPASPAPSHPPPPSALQVTASMQTTIKLLFCPC